MASNVPIVGQINWIGVAVQFLFIALFIFIFDRLNFNEPFIFGCLTYSLSAFILRNSIAKAHRHAMKLVKQKEFNDAIPFFENSVDYFTRNNWVDKYRLITLLSPSKMGYREMGLCNIAFCYSQTGKGLKAKDCYKKILGDYPENGIATAGLNMLNSLDSNT